MISHTTNLIQFVKPRFTIRKRLESNPSTGISDSLLIIPSVVRIQAAAMNIARGRSSFIKLPAKTFFSPDNSGGFQKYNTTAIPSQTRGRAKRELI
jgi:hypothetical protein